MNPTLNYQAHMYDQLFSMEIPQHIWVGDHLDGFDADYRNKIFDRLSQAQHNVTVYTGYIVNQQVRQNYPSLNIKYRLLEWMWESLLSYSGHEPIAYKNFICSFNGTGHISRQLLSSALNKMGWFDPRYSTKQFQIDYQTVDGNIQRMAPPGSERFYRKFIISDSDQDFHTKIYGTGPYQRPNHLANLSQLHQRLSSSFLHLVSETMATSYHPFVTEKLLYSVVTRGLFVGYAQPLWHQWVNKFYGFKLYDKIFNYSFDTIINPIQRLVALIEMVSKFQNLSTHDWHDLYLIEQDSIEYNYNHYMSRAYTKTLESNL